MRRIVVLLVLAVVGAGLFGLSNFSSGLGVNGSSLSASTMRAELSAIANTPAIQCYVTALDPSNFAAGAGGATMSTAGAAAWSNLRVEGLAIEQYVRAQFKFRASASELATAEASLEQEMTQAATANQLTCPATSAQALAAMPSEMRQAQVEAQAASLFLVSRLNSTIPLTAASLQAYYSAHRSSYDTLCVAVALVSPSDVSAFESAQAAGQSMTALVKKYSLDPVSRAHGGAYGCYPPTASVYANVRADVGSSGLDTFSAPPQSVSQNGVTYALFVAATKRSATPFAEAEAAVLNDVRSLNANGANSVKESILYRAAISVDPAYGRWGLASSGPGVFAPALPSAHDVPSATTLSTAGASTYK